MKDKEPSHIEGKTEWVTFKQFVEEMLGVPFEEVYKDYINKDNEDAKRNKAEGDMG